MFASGRPLLKTLAVPLSINATPIIVTHVQDMRTFSCAQPLSDCSLRQIFLLRDANS